MVLSHLLKKVPVIILDPGFSIGIHVSRLALIYPSVKYLHTCSNGSLMYSPSSVEKVNVITNKKVHLMYKDYIYKLSNSIRFLLDQLSFFCICIGNTYYRVVYLCLNYVIDSRFLWDVGHLPELYPWFAYRHLFGLWFLFRTR